MTRILVKYGQTHYFLNQQLRFGIPKPFLNLEDVVPCPARTTAVGRILPC